MRDGKTGSKTVTLRIGGMTCVNCAGKIERKLRGAKGIITANVDYASSVATVSYDGSVVTLRDIETIIERLDYRILRGDEASSTKRVALMLGAIVAIYALLQLTGLLNLLVPSELAKSSMGYGMLFLVGIVTSVHCVAMCGGINLSQCLPKRDSNAANDGSASGAAAMLPTVLYNAGRVVSYTLIGFILGAVGMFIGGVGLGLPSFAQGLLKIIAGLFMVVMGLNMLNLFPWLRRLQPRLPRALTNKARRTTSASPFIVGLLNGLMPCGPLQSMQIVALASANPIIGGLSMLMFSLGTVPLMLGLGSLISALGQKFAGKVMTAGSLLVVSLGLAMLSQGGALSNLVTPEILLGSVAALCVAAIVSTLPFKKPYKTMSTVATLAVAAVLIVVLNLPQAAQQPLTSRVSTAANSAASDAQEADDVTIIDGKQIITSTLSPGRYPTITVTAGTPVKWVINAPQGSVNGCNGTMMISAYGIEHTFKIGENVIEFTPTETGAVRYSCWMGMIRGTINVVDGGA